MTDFPSFEAELRRRGGTYGVGTKSKTNVNTLEKTYFFDNKPVRMTEAEYNKVRFGLGTGTKVRQSVIDQIYQPGEPQTTPPPSKWGGNVVRRDMGGFPTPNPLKYNPYGEGKPGGEYDRRNGQKSLPSDSDYYRRSRGPNLPSDTDYYKRKPIPSSRESSKTPNQAPNRFNPNQSGTQAPSQPYTPSGDGTGRNPITGKQNPAYKPDPPRSPNYTSQPPTPYRSTYRPNAPSRPSPIGGVGALGGVGGLMGQGQQYSDAVKRKDALQDEKRRLMEKYGLTSDEFDRETSKYTPKFVDGEMIQNPWEHDALAPGGWRDALAARERGMTAERFKRERFGDQRTATPLEPGGWKNPFDTQGMRDKTRRMIDDEIEWQKERERNRKKWDEKNPLEPFEPRIPTDPDWGPWEPFDPFGFPPGSPGGAVPPDPLDHLAGFMVYSREDFQATFKVSDYGKALGATDTSRSSVSIKKTFFRIDYDIFINPSPIVVPDPVSNRSYLMIESTGMYASFSQMIYFMESDNYKGGYDFFQFLYDFSSVLLTEAQLSQSRTGIGEIATYRYEYGIGSQELNIRNSIIAIVPHFNPGTRPGRPNSGPKKDPPKNDPKEDDDMACRYATDIEVPTTIFEYDELTKAVVPKQEMVHTSINEFATKMSKQVAELHKLVDKIGNVLDVPKYSQPAGKPILPNAFIDVVGPALFATGGIAALPAKTLPQEMVIFQALSHYLSGFQLLGKTQLTTDVTNPNATKMAPKSAMGFNIMAHDITTGLIGRPNDIKRVDGSGNASASANKNATDAIEKTQAIAESNAVDISGMQQMLFNVIKQNEMLILMVDEQSAKVEMLIKDAGFKIDYEKREIPTVVSHKKKNDTGGTPTPESVFSWDNIFKQSKATRLIPVWSKNNEIDKHQLGLKTNMSAQVAASSVLFPISKKGKAQFPNLKTKSNSDFNQWASSIMNTEDLRDGGLSSVPKIEIIDKGVTKSIVYQGPTIGKQ